MSPSRHRRQVTVPVLIKMHLTSRVGRVNVPTFRFQTRPASNNQCGQVGKLVPIVCNLTRLYEQPPIALPLLLLLGKFS